MSMKKTGLLANIARIGSLDYQRRWCVHGTAEEYVLLEELIEPTIYAAKQKASHPVLSKNLTEQERVALFVFYRRMAELLGQIPWNDTTVSVEDIVEPDDAMEQIRKTANKCLNELRVSFTSAEL